MRGRGVRQRHRHRRAAPRSPCLLRGGRHPAARGGSCLLRVPPSPTARYPPASLLVRAGERGGREAFRAGKGRQLAAGRDEREAAGFFSAPRNRPQGVCGEAAAEPRRAPPAWGSGAGGGEAFRRLEGSRVL